jgi:DNA-binding winged helix-turn-helix (wHTH) protein/TolB-like protein/Tfp pilus assembly protein PilF
MKPTRTTSFDGWVLRADVGELVKDGRKIRLQQRPLLVLEELLAHPGELVTREQLIARLWPKGVVDFDTGLNTAVSKLRVALDDVGDMPRFVETIPRKGYRFIGRIDPPAVAPPTEPPASASAESRPPPALERRTAERRAIETAPVSESAPSRRGMRYALAIVATLVVGAVISYLLQQSGSSSQSHTEVLVQRPVANDVKIALLPLIAATTSEADSTLAKIVSDVLRHRLNKLPETIVIGTTSLRRTDGEPLEPRKFGTAVHAQFVIDGKLARQPDQLRLALQVVEVATGERVWSFEETRPMSDVAGLVEVAVRGVARHLGVRADSNAQPVEPRPVNLEAYGPYLQAVELMLTQRVGDGESALELFRRATVLDPQFARAYLGLAQALIFSAGLNPLADAERKKRDNDVFAAADRAFALDPSLGEALIERARLTADSAEADRLYREGLRLAPNSGRGHQRYAEFLFDEYRRGEAREAIERAHIIDPMEPRVTVRLAMYRYLVDGDGDAHDRLIREVLADHPKMVQALAQLGMSTWLNGGDFAEAIRIQEEVVQIDPDYDEVTNMLATMYLDVDDPASASAVLERAVAVTPSIVDVALYRRDRRRAAQLARSSPTELWITKWGAPEAWALRDEAMATGDYTTALELMARRYELVAPWGPRKTAGVQVQNRGLGVVYAHTLVLAGQIQRGRKLAQSILAQLDGESVGRVPFYMSRDRAAAYAVLGDKERTLDELENSLKVGHYSYWWYYAENDPLFENLHTEPRFQAVVAQVTTHRAQQRELLDEMRREGRVPKR